MLNTEMQADLIGLVGGTYMGRKVFDRVEVVFFAMFLAVLKLGYVPFRERA